MKKILYIGLLFLLQPITYAIVLTLDDLKDSAKVIAAYQSNKVEVQIEQLSQLSGKKTIEVKGTVDVTNKTYSLYSEVFPAFIAGPVNMSKIKLIITEKGYHLEGNVTVFNQPGIMSVDKLTPTEATLKMSFDKLNLNLTPWLQVGINNMNLKFTQGQPPIIYVEVYLFNKNLILTFEKINNIPSIIISTDTLGLEDLVPDLPDDVANKVRLLDLKLTIANYQSNLKDPVKLTLNGFIDLTAFDLPIDNISKLALQGELTSTSIKLIATLKSQFNFEDVGNITDPKIQLLLTLNPGKVVTKIIETTLYKKKSNNAIFTSKLSLMGKLNFNIPEIGILPIDLDASYSKPIKRGNGTFSLAGKVAKPITFKDITIKNVEVSSLFNKTSFKGDSIITFGDKSYEASVSLNVINNFKPSAPNPEINSKDTTEKPVDTTEKPVKEEESSSQANKSKRLFTVNLEGKLKLDSITPFPQVPGLEQITIRELGIVLISETIKIKNKSIENNYISLIGKSRILNTDVKTTLRIANVDNKTGVILEAMVEPGWKISDSFPQLRGTEVEKITFEGVGFIASSIDLTDPKRKIKIQRGLGLFAKVKLTGNLENISKLVKISELEAYGVIGGPNIITLKAGIQGKLGTDTISLSGLNLEISGQPSIAILCSITVKPSIKDEPLLFTGRLGPTLTGFLMAGTMEGTWNDPFGVKNLQIGNLAIQGQISWAGVPSAAGIAGTLVIGEKSFEMAAAFGADPRQTILRGKANALTLKDFTDLANKMGAKISIDTLPNLGFRDVEIQVAATQIKIGELTYDEGLTFKGKILIYNWDGIANVSVSSNGIILEGALKAFKLGTFFSATGAGPDKIKGTPDDGPLISLKATTGDLPSFFLSAEANFLGINGDIRADISKDALSFSMDGKIFNVFESGITVNSVVNNLGIPSDLLFVASLKADFQTVLLGKVKGLIQALADEATKTQTKINNLQQEINTLTTQIQKERESGINTLNNAKQKLDTINSNISINNSKIKSLKNSISSAENWIKQNWIQVQAAAAKGASIVKWKAEIVGLQGANTTQAGYKIVAENALDAAKKLVANTPIELDPRLVKKFADKKALEIYLIPFNTALEINNTLSEIKLIKGTISGSAEGLGKGKNPILAATFSYKGQTFSISVNFDPAHFDQTMADIAAQVKDQVIKLHQKK